MHATIHTNEGVAGGGEGGCSYMIQHKSSLKARDMKASNGLKSGFKTAHIQPKAKC